MYSMYYSLIIYSCIVCKMHVFDARIKDCLYYMGVVCIGLCSGTCLVCYCF